MVENAGYMPGRIVAGASIWLAAANTLQSGVDLTFTGITPAAGYSLAYQFSAMPTPVSVAATANGAADGWTLEVTGAQTLLWAPGSLAYIGIATIVSGGVTRSFVVDQGVIAVDASPLRVSAWAAVLTSVDAAIATYAVNPNGSISIDGMSVSYRSLAQLTELRDYAAYRMQQDTAKSGSGRRIIRARFT